MRRCIRQAKTGKHNASNTESDHHEDANPAGDKKKHRQPCRSYKNTIIRRQILQAKKKNNNHLSYSK
jgi:hypothetical protein